MLLLILIIKICKFILNYYFYSRFPKGITSGIKSIRKQVLGQGEFSLIQIMSSEYDLKTAVNMYRFVLVSEVKNISYF